jgi:hypothetical protein
MNCVCLPIASTYFFLVKIIKLMFLLHVLRLAASLAAEEEANLTGKGKQYTVSVPLQEAADISEDDDEDDGEMIFVSIWFLFA